MQGLLNEKKLVICMTGLPARGKVLYKAFINTIYKYIYINFSTDVYIKKIGQIFELDWIYCQCL